MGDDVYDSQVNGSGESGQPKRTTGFRRVTVGDDGIPRYRPIDDDPNGWDATITGIVLAAGTSSRYGDRNKLLREFDGKPIVWHAVTALTAANVASIVVVVGHQSEAVRGALGPIDVTVVENKAHARGQATSVRTGIKAARASSDPDAALIALGDMPFIAPDSINRLVDAYRADIGSILAAGYHERRGNPVLFDATHFDDLESLSGDTGARHLILDCDRAAVIETDDPGVRYDVDTQDDLW